MTAPLIFGALGVGFLLGVLSAASLDRRAAFRRPTETDRAGWADENGFTPDDHLGLEDVLRMTWRPGR